MRFPEDREVVFRVRIRTGAEAERFELGTDATSVLQRVRGVTFDGPGTVVAPRGGHADPCPFVGTYGFPIWRGWPGFFYSAYVLEVPAQTETTLVVTTELDDDAPRPSTRYGLAVRARNPYDGGTLQTTGLGADSPAIPPSGRLGVQIDLALDVPTAKRGCTAAPAFVAGRTVRISGSTQPPLAGHEIELRLGGPTKPLENRPLRVVRTGADGTFSYSWRPQHIGAYAVAAVYRAQAPDRADDFTFPLRFTLTDPEAAGSPSPRAVYPDRVSRLSLGVLRLGARCFPGRGACGGRIFVLRRGRLLGTRRFTASGPGELVIPVRLPRGLGNRPFHVLVRSRSDTGDRIERTVRVEPRRAS